MKRLTLGVIAAVAPAFVAAAQSSAAFNTTECPDRSSADRWCRTQLVKEGWTLKYKSESPSNLMDVYWMHEVWLRERTAVLCSHVGGRGGIRINECQILEEVVR
jgi:hypothetical protein